MVSSPKNKNVVINYSPSCCSKPVRPLFIFRTQIKIFSDEIRELSVWPSIDSNATEMFPDP